jgi:hypothetical protein
VRKRSERFREVTRTQFGGSTRAARECRQTKQLIARGIYTHRKWS